MKILLVNSRTYSEDDLPCREQCQVQRSATLFPNVTALQFTRYRLCYVLKAITLSSNDGSNFDRAITLRHDKGPCLCTTSVNV
jgi:hypothetical protein